MYRLANYKMRNKFKRFEANERRETEQENTIELKPKETASETKMRKKMKRQWKTIAT